MKAWPPPLVLTMRALPARTLTAPRRDARSGAEAPEEEAPRLIVTERCILLSLLREGVATFEGGRETERGVEMFFPAVVGKDMASLESPHIDSMAWCANSEFVLPSKPSEGTTRESAVLSHPVRRLEIEVCSPACQFAEHATALHAGRYAEKEQHSHDDWCAGRYRTLRNEI
eukprot:364639-Chlamydomonas_euryale.AAC.55